MRKSGLITLLFGLGFFLGERGFAWSPIMLSMPWVITLWSLGGICIITALWLIFFPPKRLQKNALQVKVQNNATTSDWWPQSKPTLLNPASECTLEAEIKLCPKGTIKLLGIELHIDKHTIPVDNLPVTILDREETHYISFRIKNWVLTRHFEKPGRRFIRVIFDGGDCRSAFGISIVGSQ